MKQQINEIKRMQLIAGLITESEYQESLINEDSLEKTISFGPYTNLKYYDIPREDTVGLRVDTSDNFGKIQLSVDTKGKDFYSSKQISYLNDKLEDLADEMSDYLTKQGIENEVVDNPIGYGQEIDNLEIEISKDDLSKLGQVNEINEATLINKGQSMGVEKPIAVGDLIAWNLIDNSGDRGMGGTYAGTAIGEVTKILGSRNVAAEVISPSKNAGDIYKVNKQELKRVPQKGENIVATVSYNMGAGSGSQGKNTIQGVVVDVNMENASIKIKTEDGKSIPVKIRDLNDIKVVS